MGLRRPTDIQYKAIPSILRGEDVMAIAQTGTGKTAAFAIPVLHLLQMSYQIKRRKEVKCLVMVPTRELAAQIAEVFVKLGKYTRLMILGLYGGVEQDAQIAKLERGIDILVATPGRMFDLVNQGHIDLSQVRVLVLDEADLMLAKGFNKDIHDVLRFLPQKHQTLFFSATLDKSIKNLAYAVVTNPIRIQISPKDPVSKNVTHSVAFVEMDDKRFFLERLVQERPESKILVFVRTKVRAERVHLAMARVGIESITLHGDKEQADRLSVLDQFKTGTVKVLIATDVSARGIDIPHVDFVINYDLPEIPENYVHRVGRTGRGTHRGHAVSFCSKEEIPLLHAIEDWTGHKVNVMELSKDDYWETLSLSDDTPNDNWKLLMDQAEADMALSRKKKKKKG